MQGKAGKSVEESKGETGVCSHFADLFKRIFGDN